MIAQIFFNFNRQCALRTLPHYGMIRNEVIPMYCSNCGTLCGEDHSFCYHCGSALGAQEPEAAAVPETEADFPAEPETEAVAVPENETASEAETESAPDEDLPAAEEDIFTPEPPAPAKKGRLWPPIVIMALIFAIGTAVFFLTGGGSEPETLRDPSTPWFRVVDGTLYFDEDAYIGGSVLVVPEVIGTQTVTAVGAGCFEDCDTLVSVILPETVTQIGARAFYDCDALRGIELPSQVRLVDSEAFVNCNALESVVIPAQTSRIASGAFDGCGMLFYIFYDGSISNWFDLYPDYITPFTYVSTEEGIFRHIVKA
jgi:hypothetical protein